MPNYCHNELRAWHFDDDRAELVQTACENAKRASRKLER